MEMDIRSRRIDETKPCETALEGYFTERRSGSEAGSYSRLIDFVSLNSRLESHKEEERRARMRRAANEASSSKGS